MLNALTGTSGMVKGHLLRNSFDYLFGNVSKTELKDSFRFDGLDPSKLELIQNGYICRNCKLYLYAMAMLGEDIDPLDYGVERKDRKALIWVSRNIQIDEGCDPWTLRGLESNERLLVEGLKTYIGKFITKKMTFLLKSYGWQRHDIEADLQCAGLWALHKKYPYFDSPLHAANTVKTAIHNKGIDLITKSTRHKNQRLIRNTDGTFEAVNVDLSALKSLEAPTPFELRYRDERLGLQAIQKRMNDRSALYISLARGDYSADFSEYLGIDNRQAAEGNYHSYLKKIDSYLGVSLKERNRFFEKLRRVI